MSKLKTLKDFEEECVPCETPLMCEGQAELIKALREAAKEWLNVFKKNREMDQDDESGVDEAFIRIFFNLKDEDK